MNNHYTVALAMIVSFGLGAVAIDRLNAQGKPAGAYAIVDISEITDPEGFRQVGPKAGKAAASAGGQHLARTENIVALHGTPPKRFIIIAFDSIKQAQEWDASSGTKEVNEISDRSAKSRRFIVEGCSGC
jgi:uncharacterized protein (DUF1330 family)